jgi:hypothetical protein
MGTFVLTQVVQHMHEYKQHIGVETPASNDADISTDALTPKGRHDNTANTWTGC